MNAVAFDLDNTLYEHAQFVTGAYADAARAAAASTGIDPDELKRRILGDWRHLTSRANTIFSDALKDHGVYTPELESEMVRAYRNHAPKIAPYPGVLRGLKRLRRMGVPLGLLSDGQPAVQRRKLAALKLNNLFDAIVITGDIGPRFYKPHPAGFEQLIRELDTDPARTVYVGDNPATDFVTARKLGMTTVRVRRGEYAAVPHDPRTVDVCVHSAAEALQWLLQQLGRNGTRPSRNTHNTEAPTR